MIYVHVPFCRSFCTYCGFYSEICSRNASQQVQNRVFDAYADAVLDEITQRLRENGDFSVAVGLEDVGFADPTLKGPPSYDAEGGTVSSPTAPKSLIEAASPAAVIDEIFDRADFFGRGVAPTTRALRPAKALLLGPQASKCLLSSPRDLGNVRGRGPSLAMGGAERSEAVGGTMTPAKGPDSLYIGGGTPSVLPVEVLEGIVQALGPADYEEFTVEVNPDDIVEKGVEYVRRLVAMGVNRVSMGVQSFDDGILRWMNRRHDAAAAREAFRILRDGGVRNISIDLIFGLSQLSEDQWRASIAEALALGPEHISAYQLSVEEGSALSKLVADGRYIEAPDEQCRRQYDILCEELAKAGYRHYEVSNWTKPGFEAVHNSAYWRRVSYIGLGPGAHSFDAVAGVRSWNSEELASYDGEGRLHRWTSSREVLSESEAAEERIMLALRTAAGLPYEELVRLVEQLGHTRALVDELLEDGSLVLDGGNVRIPEDRFFVSDGIIARVI